MATSTFAEIVQRVRELGPFHDDAVAGATVSVVLRGLGRRLLPDEREALARALPSEAAQLLRVTQMVRHEAPDPTLSHDLAVTLRIGLGLAVERLEIVVRALGEAIGPEACGRLTRALPELSPLLEPRDGADPPLLLGESRSSQEREGDTLASGRPGSKHPLSSGH